MGTRSLTFVGAPNDVVMNMYRQMDGYPSGMGKDLYNFLKNVRMTNGLPCGEDKVHYANGAGCLAAQIVAHFKDGAGGIYLHNPSVRDYGQDYEYHITADTTGIKVRVIASGWGPYPDKTLYDGDVEGFGAFCDADAA